MTTYGEFVMHCSRALLLETLAHHPTLVASTSPKTLNQTLKRMLLKRIPLKRTLLKRIPRLQTPFGSPDMSPRENRNRTRTRSRESGIIFHHPPEEAFTAINNFTSAFGYELSVKRSVAKKGVLKHVYYTCVRGGKLRTQWMSRPGSDRGQPSVLSAHLMP